MAAATGVDVVGISSVKIVDIESRAQFGFVGETNVVESKSMDVKAFS